MTQHLITALTEPQVDKLIDLGAASLHALGEAVKTAWVALSPALIGYLAWRQHTNNKARKEGQATITDKLDENTELTKALSPGQILLGQLRDAQKVSDGHEIHTSVKLPGFEYEAFELSTGATTLWKQEPFEGGKRVRFSVTGAAEMRFHSHDVEEVLTGVKGVLIVESAKGIHFVGPGETFTSPSHAVHAVRFTDYGEIVADWIGQTSDDLKIIIYTGAPK